MEPMEPAEPAKKSRHDTVKFSVQEILARLEEGRVYVRRTDAGSTLETAHAETPMLERRQAPGSNLTKERRNFLPLEVPTLFPEKGAILILLVGGLADQRAISQPVPFWNDDEGSSYLIWQALRKAGLLHKKDEDFAMGRGGFWDECPPRTRGLAMTYAGFSPQGEIVDFDLITRPWNLDRLQTLIFEAHTRSIGKLKVLTLGNAARVMVCASAYGLSDVPVLSISEPTPEALDALRLGQGAAAEHWIEWAANILTIGKC
jgi:hypothetical protein